MLGRYTTGPRVCACRVYQAAGRAIKVGGAEPIFELTRISQALIVGQVTYRTNVQLVRCVMLKLNNRVLDIGPSYRQVSARTIPGIGYLTGLILFLTVCAFWGAIIYLAAEAL